MTDPRRAALIDAIWRRHHTLRYRLHADQRAIRDAWLAASGRVFVLCCSRRWGKSWLGAALCIETAISKPGARIAYAAPTMKMAREIIVPHLSALLEDCPDDMAPTFNRSELSWQFPNGSRILLAGCDNQNAERLRGTSLDLAVVDEAGFMADLRYVVQSILLPQLITTGGRIFMPSTPSKSPVHDFTTYCLEAEAEGRYAHRTIHDAPHITPELASEFMRESGGEDSSDWRREYLAEVVVDEDAAVLPEFTKHLRDIVVGDVELPEYVDRYVSIDVGFHDLTVALFAAWDFPNARIIVLDERVYQHAHSAVIAPDVLAAERALWGDVEPFVRVADCDAVVRADLAREHGLVCRAPRKDDKHAAVNATRMALANGQIVIHERCRTLIAHGKGAIWNRQRTSFERSGTFGHFDGVDALIYLNRHVDRNSNPFPRFHRGETHHSHWLPPEESKHDGLGAIVRPRRRIRR